MVTSSTLPFTQAYELPPGKLVGSCGYIGDVGFADGHRFIYAHYAFFCDICGDVWARIIYTPNLPNAHCSDRHQPKYRHCVQHGDGSLLLRGLPAPRIVLARELDLEVIRCCI